MLDQTNAEMSDMTSEGNTSQNTDNIGQHKLTEKQVVARARQLASTEGKGDNSRPGLFMLACEAAHKRALTSDPKSKHAAMLFHEYSIAAAAARGVGWKKQDSEKQQVSKLNAALRLGELPHVDGPALLNKVAELQREEREANEGKMDYSPFDGMVRVARWQINESPGAMLTEEVIKSLLRKQQKDDPTEADILERHVKAMNSTIEAKKESAAVSEESRAALREACSTLITRISELGGSTADRKRLAKAQAEVSEITDRLEQARAVVAARQAGIEVRTE